MEMRRRGTEGGARGLKISNLNVGCRLNYSFLARFILLLLLLFASFLLPYSLYIYEYKHTRTLQTVKKKSLYVRAAVAAYIIIILCNKIYILYILFSFRVKSFIRLAFE